MTIAAVVIAVNEYLIFIKQLLAWKIEIQIIKLK